MIGPSSLVGNVGGGGVAIGGEFEYALSGNHSFGDGTVGLGVRLHTYSIDESSGGVSASLRVTPVAFSGNYHFPVSNIQLDPYVGLALGYATASYSVSAGDYNESGSSSSGTYLMIDGGGRYFFNPRTAVQAGLSLGSRGDVGLIRLAAMFKF
jgi:outer membrane protein W